MLNYTPLIQNLSYKKQAKIMLCWRPHGAPFFRNRGGGGVSIYLTRMRIRAQKKIMTPSYRVVFLIFPIHTIFQSVIIKKSRSLCSWDSFKVLIILRPCQLRWRDCSSCASSFIPFALSGSHDRCAPRIVPNSPRLLDSSTNSSNFARFQRVSLRPTNFSRRWPHGAF